MTIEFGSTYDSGKVEYPGLPAYAVNEAAAYRKREAKRKWEDGIMARARQALADKEREREREKHEAKAAELAAIERKAWAVEQIMARPALYADVRRMVAWGWPLERIVRRHGYEAAQLVKLALT